MNLDKLSNSDLFDFTRQHVLGRQKATLLFGRDVHSSPNDKTLYDNIVEFGCQTRRDLCDRSEA